MTQRGTRAPTQAFGAKLELEQLHKNVEERVAEGKQRAAAHEQACGVP